MISSRAIAAFGLLLLLPLAGCDTTTGTNPASKAVDSILGKRAASEARLSTAAATAIAEGKTQEALEKYEKLHKRRPSDRDVAVNYAQLLRKTGDPQQALKVLKPFMSDANPHPLVLTEYAASQIALGQFEEAESKLDTVLENEKFREYHNDAWNLMGVSLDARGEHEEAEQMFREALATWKGDPTSVMNNLGLCLASRGKFDESLTTLRQALIMSPDKEEIARNVRIVEDLRNSVVPKAPVNLRKKKAKAG